MESGVKTFLARPALWHVPTIRRGSEEKGEGTDRTSTRHAGRGKADAASLNSLKMRASRLELQRPEQLHATRANNHFVRRCSDRFFPLEVPGADGTRHQRLSSEHPGCSSDWARSLS